MTQPAPTAGAARPERTYTYDTATKKTTVTIAGFSGTAESVTYDSQGQRHRPRPQRPGSPPRPSGTPPQSRWPPSRPTARRRRRSTHLDAQVTDAYGPAPTACFNATTYLPVATPVHTTGCGVAVPHTHNGYDQGITGLAAAYWTNGTFAGGRPACTRTIGSADQTWSSPPVTGAKWSARLTGTIDLGTAGTWTFGSETTQTVHVYHLGRPGHRQHPRQRRARHLVGQLQLGHRSRSPPPASTRSTSISAAAGRRPTGSTCVTPRPAVARSRCRAQCSTPTTG